MGLKMIFEVLSHEMNFIKLIDLLTNPQEAKRC